MCVDESLLDAEELSSRRMLEYVENQILFFGTEADRLPSALQRCSVWHEAQIKREIKAVKGVIESLLIYKLRLNRE